MNNQKVDLKISFPWGIPGLEDKEFSLFQLAEESPFFFLQSAVQPGVGLLLINPFIPFRDYEFDLSDDLADQMEITDQSQLAVFCAVNTSRGMDSATVNLMAPVIINTDKLTGKQVVLNDSKYSLRAPLAIIRAVEEGRKNACTGA
ncbi:MAG: flagellar assembly protein FliW [Desulfocucumaceae bacterium]